MKHLEERMNLAIPVLSPVILRLPMRRNGESSIKYDPIGSEFNFDRHL